MAHCPKACCTSPWVGPCAGGRISLAFSGRGRASCDGRSRMMRCLDGDALFQCGPHCHDQGQATKLIPVWFEGKCHPTAESCSQRRPENSSHATSHPLHAVKPRILLSNSMAMRMRTVMLDLLTIYSLFLATSTSLHEVWYLALTMQASSGCSATSPGIFPAKFNPPRIS